MQTENIQRLKRKIPIGIINILIIGINFLILQSATRNINLILSIQVLYGFINLGVIAAFVGIVYSLAGKLWVSELICSLICVVYSAVNQYVIEFHGSPLTIPEFSNARTAINVLPGYSLAAVKPLVVILLICILCIVDLCLCRVLKKYETKQAEKMPQKSIIKRALIFLCGFMYIGTILSSGSLLEPLRECWTFKEAIGQYGYPLYFLASGLEYEIQVPAGYSEDIIASIPIEHYSEKLAGNNRMPDIILILNESFYDISLVSDVEADVDYMGQFYNMKNTISGHAVVPKIGGGTNHTEYELLTSNSTYLLQGITPFQTLDMSDATSMVLNLKELGYYTIGMHPSAPGNYARNTGYALLGFDEIHFVDDFINKEYYGNRELVTDACAYGHMIQWYENAIQGSKPVFSYLLTIQNHGDWIANTADEDIVHVESYSNTSSQRRLNEYLSCVSLSVSALNKLIEYFQNSERPVILCMVGDHAPAFIGEISRQDDNNAILQRATPFIIWANFPIEEKRDVWVSMNELGPLLLSTGGYN